MVSSLAFQVTQTSVPCRPDCTGTGESTRTRKPNTKGVSRTWVGHEMIDELIHPLLLQIPPVDRPSEVVRLGPVCVHVPFTLNAKERAELKDSALRTAWLE